MTSSRVLPFALLIFTACGDSADKPLTEEEARAREVSERDDRLTGLRYSAYQKVRGGIFPQGTVPGVSITGNDLGFLLGVIYAGAGNSRLALYEASGIDVAAFRNERERAGNHLLRGYVYSSYGWTRLAREEFEVVANIETHDPAKADLIRLLVHYGMVILAVCEKDFDRAALEIRRNRELFEGDAIGEVCLGLMSANEGDYRAAADHLDQVIQRGVLGVEWDEKLKKLSTDLREAGSPLEAVKAYFLAAAADRVLESGSEFRTKFENALIPVRERADKLLQIMGAGSASGEDDPKEAGPAESAPAEKTGEPEKR